MRATSSSIETGLVQKSSPSPSAFTLVGVSDVPVRNTTGRKASAARFLRARQTATPSMPGRPRSSTIRSAPFSRNRSIPEGPSGAQTASKPLSESASASA